MRFRVSGIGRDGTRQAIVVEAESEKAAIAEAEKRGLSATKVDLDALSTSQPADLDDEHSRWLRLESYLHHIEANTKWTSVATTAIAVVLVLLLLFTLISSCVWID